MKKITELELARLLINKEMEIAGGPVFDTIEEMSAWQKEHPEWFTEYSFKIEEEFMDWKNYFISEFYNCFPKRKSKAWMEQYFNEFNFQYGLKCDYRIIFKTK